MKHRFLYVVCLIVFFSWGYAQPAETSSPPPKKRLTVQEAISYRGFAGLPRSVQWLPGGKKFSYIKFDPESRSQSLWIYDARKGTEEQILTGEDLKTGEGEQSPPVSLFGYRWLPDAGGLILTGGGDVWHFNLSQRKLRRLTQTEAVEEEVTIAPGGRRIAFVRENDLYVLELSTGAEKRLTHDGSDTILNGKLDWLYQEELVGRGIFRGYFWSPKSDRIAYLRFDQSQVPVYPLVDWSPYHPTVKNMRYPKAGDPNPIVTIGVVSLEDGQTVWLDTGRETDVYFPRVYWLPDGQTVAFMRLDRRQQHLEFLFADAATGNSRVVVEERDPHWVNVGDFVYFFKKKKQFLWGSERTGYNHLYLYDYNGKLLRQLTSGEWAVEDLVAVDEKGKWVYFTATEKDIRERHLYRVKTDGSRFSRITGGDGNHRINMPHNGRYFLDYFSNVHTNTAVTVYRADGRRLHPLVKPDNSVKEEYLFSEPELLTFTGDNGITYYAMMIKPPDFDPHRKYPVLINVYGGPHAQVVRNSFGGGRLWDQYLAQQGIIVFRMDNRGAAGRGHEWETPIYRQMGKIELEDQLRGVAYLKSLPYVDTTRIGIWGWSYGGYMTLYALTHSRVFRCGISVAPVTDWRDYDTAYTERYMGLPQENEEGYRLSAPVNAADSLHGRLLLVHGTGDDNVHMQNAIHMIDALIDAGKQFRVMFYPNQMHGISARKDRLHLFQMMADFLKANLVGEGRDGMAKAEK
ncbi:MAG: S9 family peptidase [Calditrichaeota bacterium]|nr:MAG: S9 family peptidase [Calditrichota bacterium]